MRLPNFLIIGAAKSGTTSVYTYLKQHPQIYMSPIKETNFFVYEGQSLDFRWWGAPPRALLRSITDLDSYKDQFDPVSDEIAIGEASPLYLYHPRAPKRISHYLPDIKLIAILRNPVDRAFSHFTHLLGDNREPCSFFGDALEEEKNRMSEGWSCDYNYLDMGYYYQQLKRYYDLFNLSNIRVFLYEDLVEDEHGLLSDVFRFLNVESDFVPDTSKKINISGIPKNRFLHDFLRNSNPVKRFIKPLLPQNIRQKGRRLLENQNLSKIDLSMDTRSMLMDIYRDDILCLQNLIQRDLSHWLDG